MADNATLPATGAVIATDDVGGAHFQRVKLDLGAEGASAPITGGAVPVAPTSFTGSVLSTVVSVGTTATLLPATALTGRRTVILQASPAASATIYIGGSAVTAGVTSTGGIQLEAGQSISLDLGSAVIYGRVAAATQNLIVLEVS